MGTTKSENRLFVDGIKIKEYVYKHLTFPLPDHIYRIVDAILAEFWSETPPGACLTGEDFEVALCRLSKYDILLSPSHIQCLSSLIIKAMQVNGYINFLKKSDSAEGE